MTQIICLSRGARFFSGALLSSLFCLTVVEKCVAEQSLQPHIVDLPTTSTKNSFEVLYRIRSDRFELGSSVALTEHTMCYVDKSGNVVIRNVPEASLRLVLSRVADPTFANAITASPGHIFYVAPGHRIVAADSRSGAALWRSSSLGNLSFEKLLLSDGLLYAFGNGGIAKLNARSGTVAWISPFPFVSDVRADTRYVFAFTAGGDPPTKNLNVLNSETGALLYTLPDVWNIVGNMVLAGESSEDLWAAETSRTGVIDSDRLAFRSVTIDKNSGKLDEVRLYHPDSLIHDQDTSAPSKIFVNKATTVFELDDSTYRYNNMARTEKQAPMRFYNFGAFVYNFGDTMYFAKDDGLISARVDGTTVRRQYVAKFQSDPTRWLSQNGLLLTLTDDRQLFIVNPSNGKSRLYQLLDCQMIQGVVRSSGKVAILCGNENEPPGEIVVVRSP